MPEMSTARSFLRVQSNPSTYVQQPTIQQADPMRFAPRCTTTLSRPPPGMHQSRLHRQQCRRLLGEPRRYPRLRYTPPLIVAARASLPAANSDGRYDADSAALGPGVAAVPICRLRLQSRQRDPGFLDLDTDPAPSVPMTACVAHPHWQRP